MNRRSFLQRSSAALAAGAAATAFGCASGTGQTPQAEMTPEAVSRDIAGVGVQLYTLRSIVNDDFESVLRQVADVGYEYVEFAGYHDHSPADVRAMIDDIGLKACSGHFSLADMRADIAGVLEGAVAVGMPYLVVPSLPGEDRGSVDALKAVAAEFNRLGEACREAGLQFGFHNHWQEFEEIEGQLPYDILLSETDPELVKMELDIAWAVRAGQDPIALFEANPGRYELFHVKDLTADTELADVGQGTIDFPAIFAKADVAGLQFAIVEHDNPEEPVESIRTSLSYLREIDIA